MFVTKPVSDLRNNFKEISNLVHGGDEAVTITKNGRNDMVVMSFDHFRKLKTRLMLYEKLSVAEAQEAFGAPVLDFDSAIDEVKKQIGG